jgi:DNA-binding MarR family transcriptional regulator
MTKDRKALSSAKLDEAEAPASASTTKSALVLALLKREQGSTLAELVDATAWQPHTARAMLTGLRKKGHAIERRKRGDLTCYHLPSAEA